MHAYIFHVAQNLLESLHVLHIMKQESHEWWNKQIIWFLQWSKQLSLEPHCAIRCQLFV